VTVLLEYIASSKSLVDLGLVCVNLSEVNAQLLAKTITQVPRVDLSETGLNPEQCTSILTAITEGCRLKDLSLVCVKLSSAPETLLAEAINLLRRADIADTDLTTNQCNAIFKKRLASNTLNHLNIGSTDLSNTSPFYMSRAIGTLSSINLADTQLTPNHCNHLMTSIVSSPSLLQVNLEGVDLSEVPVEHLSEAMKKLKRVDLSDTNLKTEQTIGLLTACQSSTRLVDISVNSVSMEGVPPKLLATTVAKLQRASLSKTALSGVQSTELLTHGVESKSLTVLNLKYVNLAEVPADLLIKATKRFHL